MLDLKLISVGVQGITRISGKQLTANKGNNNPKSLTRFFDSGMQPGSMPPNSRELFQEGAAVKSFKLIEGGHFNEEGITKILLEDPAQYEGCSGTRCLKDNISDLKGTTWYS